MCMYVYMQVYHDIELVWLYDKLYLPPRMLCQEKLLCKHSLCCQLNQSLSTHTHTNTSAHIWVLIKREWATNWVPFQFLSKEKSEKIIYDKINNWTFDGSVKER